MVDPEGGSRGGGRGVRRRSVYDLRAALTAAAALLLFGGIAAIAWGGWNHGQGSVRADIDIVLAPPPAMPEVIAGPPLDVRPQDVALGDADASSAKFTPAPPPQAWKSDAFATSDRRRAAPEASHLTALQRTQLAALTSELVAVHESTCQYRQPAERLACADPVLAADAAALERLYQSQLTQTQDPDRLRRDYEDWQTRRDLAANEGRQALIEANARRLAQLQVRE